jgi:hypothetical protein
MLHAARHDEHLARLQRDGAVAQLDAQPAAQDVEQLVLVRMAMPAEGALHLGDLHVVVVEGRDDPRRPELGQRFGDVDGADGGGCGIQTRWGWP